MKFAEDPINAKYRITGYDDQKIEINGRAFNKPLVLSPMELINDWSPQSITELKADDLDELYALKPDIILIGSGKKHIFPNKDVLKRLTNENIGFEIMTTQAACRTFSLLLSEDRTVIAGLFV